MDRREFLTGTMGAALLASLPADGFAQRAPTPASTAWDAGQLRHLVPAVSDSAMLIKASFNAPLKSAPRLRVGATTASAQMTDTAGECWQFHAAGLEPGRPYQLSLTGSNGRALCQPWELATFPAAGATVDRVRVLFFTCAGGPESDNLKVGYLPTSVRNRLLRRALSFGPQVAVANGDHVYWDLHPVRGAASGNTRRLDSFNRSALAFGTTNETVLKAAVAPQIVPLYGTDFRSTPIFFLQDDHDHFDNDEGTDTIVTFPPPWFQIQLARATQRMYYPEFLPHATRPLNLPWSGSADRVAGLSESFGTIRFGRLLEVSLYDVRRTMTLAGPSAVFVDAEVEKWLLARAASSDVIHYVHAPSNPPGWSAGKWGEWYPDRLADNGTLSAAPPKPYWQSGWLAQHDRLMKSLAAMRNRIPLVVSGDLHAIAIGQMLRSGTIDMRGNPITAVLAGPIGTSNAGWPSSVRGVGATPPGHLDMREAVTPIEQHGFTIVDVTPDSISVRMFKWDVKAQPPDAIDTLEPFYTTELTRPS